MTTAKDMAAGRAMDELIAKKVMDLPVRTLNDRCPNCGSEMRFCGERSWCFGGCGWVYSPYKEYSTEISAAWEVVERIELLKHRTLEYIPDEGGWWIDDNHAHTVQVVAPTAPLAICLAALAAIGGAQ